MLPDPTSPRFLAIGSELIRLTVLTRVYHWVGHYDPALRLAVRCGGQCCDYCSSGRIPELRFVVGCYSARHGRCLFEMRERHRPILEQLDSHECMGVGCKLHIMRRGTAKNSPIDVEIHGWEANEEWDIQRLVDSLGTNPRQRIPESPAGLQDLTTARLLTS